MNYEYSTTRISHFVTLGSLPFQRAKDAVWFLQWCGVSLVSSYAMCFLQRGGVSLASSAIIYNIVKVKVTRWPVDLLTFSKKNSSRAIARSTYIHRRDVTRRFTRWPVDLLEKEPLKGNCEVQVHTPLRCSAAKGAELDFAAVWREAGAYII